MSWNEFRSELVQQANDMLWAQWSALGVRGTGEFASMTVDLEALLLGTWSLGRTDPRLFDEALGWCCRFGELVHVKRLEKLLGDVSDPVTLQIALAWSDTVAAEGGTTWKLNIALPDDTRVEEALFLTEELLPQSTGPKYDSVFANWGLRRGPFQRREYVSAPAFTEPELAQLYARKLFGAGCRAEVFALLIHDLEASTAELAEMSLYSQRLVQEVLRDLNEGGALDWNPGRGRTTYPALRRQVAEGFRMAMSNGKCADNWHGRYEHHNWPSFFLGLHALWKAAVTISQSGFEGFKAQSILSDGLANAFTYHSRTATESIVQPRLVAASFEELLRVAQNYVATLFRNEGNLKPQPHRRRQPTNT